MQFRPILLTVMVSGLLLLAACGSQPQVTTPSSPATATSPNTATSPHGGGDGQVIESGDYHLEFMPEKASGGTHLDFYLQKGEAHTPIPDAKVTAQVQLPDGTQKSLEMKYDAEGKHYTVLLPSTAPGEYRVAILSDIGGTKVNGRFRFTQ